MKVDTDVLIQRAQRGDASSLSGIAFSAKAYWGYPDKWMEKWRSIFEFSPDYIENNESWMALVDEKIVAFYTLENRGNIGWLENLWVSPDVIGKGLGKLLFDHAFSRARELDFQFLQLKADPNAEGFYVKMGMRKIGEHRSEMEGQQRILPIMEIKL